MSQLGRKRIQDRYGTLELPPPVGDGYVQEDTVIGTESRLFWAEWGNWRDRFGALTKLRSLSLENSHVATLPVTQGGPISFAASGSKIVWHITTGPCPPCTYSILGLDARTSEVFTVTTGTNPKVGLAISPNHIAWQEWDPNIQAFSLMLKDSTQETTHEITANLNNWNDPSPIALSEEYLVWIERKEGFAIKSFSVKTQQVHTIWQDASNPYYAEGLGLSGHYLLWSKPDLILFNLDTGTTQDLHHKAEGQGLEARAYSNLFVLGDTAVWSDTQNIYGLHLDSPGTILRLANNPSIFGFIDHPALAGNWLVWTFRDRLQARRLSEAFAEKTPAP